MSDPPIPEEILSHYDAIEEGNRLQSGDGRLEMARTRLLLTRYLPDPPAVVLDIGGGPGTHAIWLAELGHQVHLRDIIPKHIDQAIAAATTPLASAAVGDARRLDFADGSADAVLLLGPLYHLTTATDRLAALGEARRVLPPGGLIAAAAISRFASALDGQWRNFVADPAFFERVTRTLADGQHRNPTDDPSYFTTAYFHRPDELAGELAAAGFTDVRVEPVEGIGWIMPDFDARWADPDARDTILELIEHTAGVPELLGVSQHLLAFGRRD
ncbi:MAG: class I SAM-dependent methyltransferase [Acidimicrobiia bacterium]|nr:class I SAM-dependent methyltransferase [Acidimicrobiia bacterium]MBT8215460.1 class I SAM-dependent methyltransferase [Acidimicrobiia bacterium]NNF10789.1 class I SAM-dependent methyltransferase [Acidimicrobiia bacterium]NNL70391.1 class I SAM-dependent methyltransferase [Acidimicrobiia bacterium]